MNAGAIFAHDSLNKDEQGEGNQMMNNAIRGGYLAGVSTWALLLMSAPVAAQETNEAPQAAPEEAPGT